MPDPVGSAIANQGAKSFGALVDRLLGPTFEIMGSELADRYTRRRNVRAVVERAAARSSLDEPGSVPVRVAAALLESAQWADNAFVAEYLSGVLASARSPLGDNDSGLAWTSLVSSLPSDQLALHWWISTGYQRRFALADREDFWTSLQQQMVFGYSALIHGLGWLEEGQSGENLGVPRLFEAAYGLRRQGLITALSHGMGDFLESEVAWTRGRRFDPNLGYLTCKLTSDGVALLLHAIGEGQLWLADVSTERVGQAIADAPAMPQAPRATLVRDLDWANTATTKPEQTGP